MISNIYFFNNATLFYPGYFHVLHLSLREKKIKAIEAKLRSMEQGEMTSNPWKGILTSGNHIARVRKHPYKQFNKRPHQRQQR